MTVHTMTPADRVRGNELVRALIDNAEVIAGLRFARLVDVLRYKRKLRRAKDAADIAAMHGYLGHPSAHG